MKYFLKTSLTMVVYEFLGPYVMLITFKGLKTNLHLEVESAYLWGTPLAKKDGKSMIWK